MDALLHLVDGFGFAAQPVHLRPAGDSRPDLVPDHVAADELAIDLVVRNSVRPRADEAHLALQHVDELRQFIERGATQEPSDRRDARIGLRCLADLAAVLEDGHRPELVDENLLALESVTALLEEHRSRRGELDRHRDEREHGRQQQQPDGRQHDVGQALRRAVRAMQRRVADRERRHAVDVDDARLDEVEGEQVRYEVDAGGRVAQVMEQRLDARRVGQRQRHVDRAHAVLPYEIRHRAAVTDQRHVRGVARDPLGAAKVEEAEEGIGVHAVRELEPDVVRADDQVLGGELSLAVEPQRRGGLEPVGGGQRAGSKHEPGEQRATREGRAHLEGERRRQQDGHHRAPFNQQAHRQERRHRIRDQHAPKIRWSYEPASKNRRDRAEDGIVDRQRLTDGRQAEQHR